MHAPRMIGFAGKNCCARGNDKEEMIMIMMNLLFSIDYRPLISITIQAFHFTTPIIVICHLGIAFGITFGSPSRSLWVHFEGLIG